jgi:DNA-binding NarL/FixJ family response regulator
MTHEATETFGHARAPLGLVWVKGTRRVRSLGLEKALGAGARVHKGHEGPKAEAPAAVIYCPDGVEEVAQEVQKIRAQAPDAAILVFAPTPNLRLARGALRGGASGLIHAGMPPEQILRALSVALRGKVVLPRGLLRLWVDEQRPPDLGALLSARQREILELLAEGSTNAELAGRLFLSESTVKQHLRAAYKALGVKNRTEAAALWRGRGWRGVTPREMSRSSPSIRRQ